MKSTYTGQRELEARLHLVDALAHAAGRSARPAARARCRARRTLTATMTPLSGLRGRFFFEQVEEA
ncbi:MAG: hypothetical protein V9F00_02590 [Nocardioides sp.]